VLISSVVDRVRAHAWARRSLMALPVVAIYVLFVATGLRGVDFGSQWDENEAQIKPVREMVSTGLLLPRASGYPGFSKWLTLLPAWPSGIKAAVKNKGDARAAQAAMVARVNAPDFTVTVRRVYVVFSALAIVWVWAAALALRRPWWEATAAAAAIGLSWEFAYHSRWVAVDCPLVQFSALTVFMLALYFRDRRTPWLYAAAFAAGLSTGTKYQAVTLLFPVWVASALTMPRRPVRAQLRRIVVLAGLAFAAFLLTTPAAIYDPFNNVDQLLIISRYYAAGHWGYTVNGFWHHLRLVFVFFGVSLFSPYKLIAILLFLSAVAGAVLWVRGDRRVGSVFACFPVVFLLFFCSQYRVMIVRNYMLCLPFLALFAARGLTEVGARLPRPWLRGILAAATVAAFVMNGAWLISAARSIGHADPADEVRAAVAYVAKHPKTRFKLSPQVTAKAKELKLTLPPNALATNPEQVVFFQRAESTDGFHWKANDAWLTKAVFGPREVNLSWYSTWEGPDRILVMTTEKAKSAAGISFVK
jgi:hypothetical protein